MKTEAIKASLSDIHAFRALYLQENNFQIRYNACHERGWSDSYLLKLDGQSVGYGSVKGKDDLSTRDAIFEFYLLPAARKKSNYLYKNLIEQSQVKYLECQTNDLFHSGLVFEFAQSIRTDTVLFKDDMVTDYILEDAEVRLRQPGDLIFEKKKDPGSFVLVKNGEVVASGGFLLHYNLPFADLYMEVRHNFRGNGFGAFVLQEIKIYCYRAGRVPAARCRINNSASKATLIKAGLRVCGYMLLGKLK